MAFERPQTLYGDKTGNFVPSEEGFGSCRSYEKWLFGSQSFETRTTKQLKKFTNGPLGNLSQRTGGEDLSKALLNALSKQWNDIVVFIDSFYQDLNETARFPKDKAWRLVVQCYGDILYE